MTPYPDNTDWVGNGWHSEPTPDTVYTVHEDAQGLTFLFVDRNGNEHALYTWADGGTTFQWRPTYDKAGSVPYTGTIPEPLYRLAESFRTYLDAAVEKE